jgi:dTDP-4-dehydrorhamnose reductase
MTVRAILVTGGSGQLGIELAHASLPQGWQVVALDRTGIDLEDPAAIAAKVAAGHEGQPWAAVINGAAYTAVDKAESDVVTAWKVNALAPAAFGEACARAGVPLVQVSTDYVFAGDKPVLSRAEGPVLSNAEGQGAWEVDDPVGPLGVYGASKLGGELAVRTSGARHAVVRTAWVVSAHGHNFIKTMLRVGADRGHLRVVGDQHGSPTSAADLAQALLTIAMRLAEDPAVPDGTFHFSNAGMASWADFATEIFRQAAERGGPTATVEPIATAEYPTPARRPANSLLSHAAIGATYGITPRPWADALGDILDQLIGAKK